MGVAQKIYAGPGELVFNGALLMAVNENGQINYGITQQKLDYAQAMHGRIGSQAGDQKGRITVTPFDNWSALPVLFPTYLGVTTAAGAGVLNVGVQPHNPTGGADLPAVIWNPSTLEIVVNRCAITRHPDVHLGVGKSLFGQVELTALPTTANPPMIGAGGLLTPFHAITESGVAKPANQFIVSDFVRERWTGKWGAVAGFGNDGVSNPIEAEEEWVISCNARYDELKVQQQTVAMKLASVEFMARCRPYGPQWSQIDAAVVATRALGSRFGSPGSLGAAIDLTLTSSQSGKTIALKNVDVIGEGFEFGGARLATGEVGFVTQVAFAGGNPQPQIVFS